MSLKRQRTLEDDDADFVTAPAPKPKKAPAKKAAAAPAGVGLCSLNKKDFGDKIKDCLTLEKYAIQPMSFSMQMDVTFFRQFFGSNSGAKITPAEYNDETPVVVAELSNPVAGQIFGVSKIKNGNRYSQYSLRSMVVILYPAEKKAQAWITI